MVRWVSWSLVCVPLLFLGAAGHACAETAKEFRVRVELGEDVGQDFGTLFELQDASGKRVGGLGFQTGYNTYYRLDRHRLHGFLFPDPERFSTRALPRPTNDCGVYLQDGGGKILARSGGKDPKTYLLDSESWTWKEYPNAPVEQIALGEGTIECYSQRVTYAGRTILELKPESGNASRFYYAFGHLYFLFRFPEGSERKARIYACPWSPKTNEPIRLELGSFVELLRPNEFLYAYGQLDDAVVVASNLGGVHRYLDSWRTIRQPDPKTSFQVYAMQRTGRRLLLGQYPTGNLFEYKGEGLVHLPKQPPVMPGVSPSAREAQTIALYGGQLYVGVWPWGEVWRQSEPETPWTFAHRFFSQPAPSDRTVHPYEDVCRKVDPVYNLWGQRIASMVPFEDSMLVSTSAKGTTPWEPRFTFLADDRWKEYGMVYRMHIPGAVSGRIAWKPGPTTFSLQMTANSLRLLQDGKVLEESSHAIDPKRLQDVRIVLPGADGGQYGVFGGKSVEIVNP